jgi:hypothetical protein
MKASRVRAGLLRPLGDEELKAGAAAAGATLRFEAAAFSVRAGSVGAVRVVIPSLKEVLGLSRLRSWRFLSQVARMAMMERAMARTMTMTIHFCEGRFVSFRMNFRRFRTRTHLTYPMIVPPAALFGLRPVGGLRARRRRSRSRRSRGCRGCRCRGGGRRGRGRGLSSTAVVRVLARAIIGAAVPGVPCHDLLVLRRVRAKSVANAAGRRVQAGEISRLAEAGPCGLVGGRRATACLRRLVQ